MSTATIQPDQTWGALINNTEEEREAAMERRYKELSALSEEERINQMTAMAKAEYDLSDAQLRVFSLSRLRTWLKMDPDMVKGIAASYDAVMLKLPGNHAMRRVSIVQTLAKDFTTEQQTTLVELLPDVFGGLKESILARNRVEALATAPAPSAAPAKKKGWWPFGRG